MQRGVEGGAGDQGVAPGAAVDVARGGDVRGDEARWGKELCGGSGEGFVATYMTQILRGSFSEPGKGMQMSSVFNTE